MAEHEGSESSAVDAARQAGVPWTAINPALRTGEQVPAGDDAGTDRTPGPPAPRRVRLTELPLEVGRLLVRHATCPAVVVLAITDGERTHRVRIGADPAAPSVETGPAGTARDISRVRDARPDELPAILHAALSRSGGQDAPGADLGAPPRLTQEGEDPALTLTAAQQEAAAALVADGVAPTEALLGLADLDERLRDALVAQGPRVSLAAVLNDPGGRVVEQPVTWSRVWVQGRLGLYRTDPREVADGTGCLRITPVAPGDVLGSAVPTLQEAMRFTAQVHDAARAATAGGAR